MRQLIRTLSLLVLLALSLRASADDLPEKIDAFVSQEMASQRIPGLALLVRRDGATTLAKGYGLANVEHQVPVQPHTIFQSGSVGKQFTATAIMMLAEEGKLALWDAALTTEKLLKKTSFDQIWTPVTLNDGKTNPYGFSWFIVQVNGHGLIHHTVFWQGFRSAIQPYFDDQLTVIVLANVERIASHALAAGIRFGVNL